MTPYIDGLVSVIIPTYKRTEQLDRAIESVLNQTYKNLELLLVNDNVPNDEFSQALMEKVVKYKEDKRFNLIFQEYHINGAAARNVGIKKAKGEYIAFLDDDDWWNYKKIERQVQILKSLSEEWGGVSCKIERYKDRKIIARLPKYKDGLVYLDVLKLKSDFATGTLLLRHTALNETGYFDESLIRHQDLQILVEFTSKYKLKQLDEYLHYCDIGDGQNRLNGDKLIIQKKAFFKSVKRIIDMLSEKDKKCIICINKFEVGYAYLKNGEIYKGMKYALSVLSSREAFKIAIKKIYSKIRIYRIE